jgi:UDP-N-acetylmuramyl pentapeptide phosphotransferase/UDP-N-acetylglucosamine-1-phosphate transferase
MPHGHLSADHDLSGPQKFHARVVPRIGGLGVMLAVRLKQLIVSLKHFAQEGE